MNKKRLLPVAIFLALCLGLLPTTSTLPLYEGLHWLSLGPVKAQSLCCRKWVYHTFPPTCVQWVPCSTIGEEEECPSQPPDQVEPGQGRDGVFDPKAPGIRIDFPPGAVSVPVEVRAYYLDELPLNVPPPPGGTVGLPFFLSVWERGKGRPVNGFDPSLTITAKTGGVKDAPIPESSHSFGARACARCHGEQIAPVPRTAVPEAQTELRLSMYDPATQSWVKLCSRADAYAGTVSGALASPTPFEESDNALFAVTLDDTPALDQAVDDQGNTTLFIPGSNFSFDVPAGTVEIGTHFEVTLLSEAPGDGPFKLLPAPVDLKACQVGYTKDGDLRQITHFSKPLKVGFEFDANTLSRAGGRANLTIVSLQDRQWVDLEEFGYRVVRGENRLTVDADSLGAFSLAVR